MKKYIVLLFLILLMPLHGHAMADTADSAILMDADSGRILFSKNSNQPKLIASTTKIMTSILAIESNRMDEAVTVDNSILKAYGSSIYLEIGEQLTLRDLVYGLMLRSGNDAAVAIATFVSGDVDSFVKKMNEKARIIGMTNTMYQNPHGLDDTTKNKSSAVDMALLQKYALTLKEYRKITSTKTYQTESNKKPYVWTNKNKLLKQYKYAISGKPGFTQAAGRTLVTSSKKDGLTLIVVTLGDPNDFKNHKLLYEYAYNNYANYKVLDKKEFHIESTYYLDDLYIKKNFYYPLTEKEKNDIKITAELEKKKYKNHDSVGEVVITLKDTEIYREKIYVSIKPKETITSWIARMFRSIL